MIVDIWPSYSPWNIGDGASGAVFMTMHYESSVWTPTSPETNCWLWAPLAANTFNNKERVYSRQ